MRSPLHPAVSLGRPSEAWRGGAGLLCTALLAITLSACALVESAAEVTVGKGQLPAIDVTFALPGPDQLLGSSALGGAGAGATAGVPGSLDAITLGHVQGLLGLQGTCRHKVVLGATVDTEGDGTPTDSEEGTDLGPGDLEVELLSCPVGGWCASWCGEQSGLLVRFGVEMAFVDAKRAKNIRDQLSADVGDAIAQVRLRFLKLSMRAGGTLDEAMTAELIRRFDIELVDEDGHRATVVHKGDLERMATGLPLRTEVPADSALTKALRERLKRGEPITVRVEATLAVAQGDLLAWQVKGTEMTVAMQPEIVISTVSLAAGLL